MKKLAALAAAALLTAGGATVALATSADAAPARHGADDAPGHVHHAHGADDAPGHVHHGRHHAKAHHGRHHQHVEAGDDHGSGGHGADD